MEQLHAARIQMVLASSSYARARVGPEHEAAAGCAAAFARSISGTTLGTGDGHDAHATLLRHGGCLCWRRWQPRQHRTWRHRRWRGWWHGWWRRLRQRCGWRRGRWRCGQGCCTRFCGRQCRSFFAHDAEGVRGAPQIAVMDLPELVHAQVRFLALILTPAGRARCPIHRGNGGTIVPLPAAAVLSPLAAQPDSVQGPYPRHPARFQVGIHCGLQRLLLVGRLRHGQTHAQPARAP
mmetsp:Transcript_22377/g.47782  ORF Transcript_22377/g.47782 Transcript_22377/m.47782 type:complete len:236 (+) Transcript_22377:1125-1832(+)